MEAAAFPLGEHTWHSQQLPGARLEGVPWTPTVVPRGPHGIGTVSRFQLQDVLGPAFSPFTSSFV